MTYVSILVFGWIVKNVNEVFISNKEIINKLTLSYLFKK